MFSKFASAEEVTGAAPAEDEEAAAEEDEKPVKEEVCMLWSQAFKGALRTMTSPCFPGNEDGACAAPAAGHCRACSAGPQAGALASCCC